MAGVKEYVSSDNVLRLIVQTDDSGDVAIGFADATSHAHARILAALSGLPADEAVQQYVQRVVSGEAVISILRVDGMVSDIWVSDDPAADAKYPMEGESIEMRYWHGE